MVSATDLFNRSRNLSTAWLTAIAAGIGAGVAIGGGGNRVVGGAVGGVTVWVIAMWQAKGQGACCAACAGDDDGATHIAPGEPAPGNDPEPIITVEKPDDWGSFLKGAGPISLDLRCAS